MIIIGKILLSVFVYGFIGLVIALALSPGEETTKKEEIIGLIGYHVLVVIIVYFIWF